MSRQPRVEIEPKMYKALQAEALMMDMSPKDLVAKWIMENLSPRALEFVGEKSKPSAVPEKIFKNKSALETKAQDAPPRARKRGGKPPYEERYPERAAEIMAYYGNGQRSEGGHSRADTIAHFSDWGIKDGLLSHMIDRMKRKS